MFIHLKGDILKCNTDAIVNPVNCVGVMGGELAKQFSGKYPKMCEDYRQRCYIGAVKTGEMDWHWADKMSMAKPTLIVNFPTKQDYCDPSLISYIQDGLDNLVYGCLLRKIESIAIPALGCGLGGLQWDAVKPLIEARFKNEKTVALIFGP